jgi:hypothetical protein
MDQPQRHGDTELDQINKITQRIIGCAIEVHLVIVEVTSVERMNPVFETQVITYLGITKKRVGLLVNVNSRLLKDGVQRIIR